MLKNLVKKVDQTVQNNRLWMEHTSTAILFNVASHESLISAVLMAAVIRRTCPECKVGLYDIRDPLASSYDGYVWIGLGKGRELVQYYQDKKLFGEIQKRSTFINAIPILPHEGEDEVDELRALDATLVSQVHDRLLEAGFESAMLLKKWSFPSLRFFTNRIDADVCCRYYELLSECYAAYYGNTENLEYILSISLDAQEEEVKAYFKASAKVNRKLSRSVRQIVVGDTVYSFLSELSEDTYKILRILRMGNRNYIHGSMGSYGNIFYSNTPIDPKVLGNMACLMLSGK